MLKDTVYTPIQQEPVTMWKKILVFLLVFVLFESGYVNGQTTGPPTQEFYAFSKGDYAEWTYNELSMDQTLMDNCYTGAYTCDLVGIGTINNSDSLRVEVLKDYDYQPSMLQTYDTQEFYDYFSITLDNQPLPTGFLDSGFTTNIVFEQVNISNTFDATRIRFGIDVISLHNTYSDGKVVNSYEDGMNSSDVTIIVSGDIVNYTRMYQDAANNTFYDVKWSATYERTNGILQNYVFDSRYLNISISLADSSISSAQKKKFPVGNNDLLLTALFMLTTVTIIKKSRKTRT